MKYIEASHNRCKTMELLPGNLFSTKVLEGVELQKNLLAGESGTGKEIFAQAIHNHNNRSEGPFIAVKNKFCKIRGLLY